MTANPIARRRTLFARARGRYLPVAWNGIAYVVPKAVLLLAGVYVARRFGHEVFARYSLAAVTLTLAGTLVGAALSVVASKHVPEFARGDDAATGTGFAAVALLASMLAATLGAAIFAAAPALSALFGTSPPITNLLRVTAFGVAGSIVNGALQGLLTGSTRFRLAAIINVFAALVFAAIIVPLARIADGAGVLAALAVFYTVAAATAAIVVRRPLRGDWTSPITRAIRSRVPRLWRYFVPMLLATGTVTPVAWLCNVLLARSAHGAIEIARFGAAYNWFAVVSAIPAVLAQVEFVRMARSRAAGDVKGLAHGYRLFTLQNLAFVTPIVAIGIAAAGPLGDLFRLDDPATRNCIRLLLASALMAGLGNPVGLFLAVIDRIWIASLLNIGWACIVLALGWILRQSGASGIAAAFLIAYSTHFVVATAIAWRTLARPISIGPAEV